MEREDGGGKHGGKRAPLLPAGTQPVSRPKQSRRSPIRLAGEVMHLNRWKILDFHRGFFFSFSFVVVFFLGGVEVGMTVSVR